MKRSEITHIIIQLIFAGLITSCVFILAGCMQNNKAKQINATDHSLIIRKSNIPEKDTNVVNSTDPEVTRRHKHEIDTNNSNSNDVDYKPVIYIYPEEKIQLSLHVSFPLGGEILTSIPEYGQGWSVSVDTSGRIDDKFDYLFYESTQPNVWQTEKGWLVKREELRTFFTDNMAKYGFIFKEIKDFVVYWVPRLKDYEYYEIYPQESTTINSVIKLDWSKEPDNILRFFYVIKGTHSASGHPMTEPVINSRFVRSGFYITEWGVIL
jgi:hypothetical protein